MPQGNGEVLQVHQNNSSSPSRPACAPVIALWSSVLATAVWTWRTARRISTHQEHGYCSHTASALLWKKYIHFAFHCSIKCRCLASYAAVSAMIIWICFGRKKGSQSLLSGETVFSGQKMFVHIFSILGTQSPLLEGSATIKRGLPLGRYPEAWGATCTWAVRARTAVCSPRMWLCPVALWDGHRRPYFNEAAVQPWSASTSLNHGLWGIRDAKHNILPDLNALRQKKSLNCSLSMSAIQVVQMTSKCFSWKEIWAGNT